MRRKSKKIQRVLRVISIICVFAVQGLVNYIEKGGSLLLTSFLFMVDYLVFSFTVNNLR